MNRLFNFLKLKKMNKSIIVLIIVLSLISSISSQSNNNNQNATCSLYQDCNSCDFCGESDSDYSHCNFQDIFCHHIESNNFEYNSKLKESYSNYFRTDKDIDSFCGKEVIELHSMEEGFTLFESKYDMNLLSKKINCDYFINNTYYCDHDSDTAKLHFELKNTEYNQTIEFVLYMIYKMGNSIRFLNLTDKDMRNRKLNRTLTKISEFVLLIDFKNNNNNNLIEQEYLEITLITDNPSKKSRIIFIIILTICIFLLALIIVLIILYFCIKKRMETRYREIRENEIIENEKKKKENEEKIKNLLSNSLKPILFNKDINANDCTNCTICIESFEIGKSEISITPCNHIFHFECLKKWIEDNVINPQCPNCKYSFLDDKNLMKSSIIHINRRDNNENNENKENKENNENNNNHQNNNNNNNNNNNGLNNENDNNGTPSSSEHINLH